MNHLERDILRDLILDFERTMGQCRHCCVFALNSVNDPANLCQKCEALFYKALEYEHTHAKFTLNDSQIAVEFQQAMGRCLDEDELLSLKAYMLDFECEDCDNMVEVIKKIVTSLRMRNPELAAQFTDD